MGLRGGESWSPGGAGSGPVAPALVSPPDRGQLGLAGPVAAPHPGDRQPEGHLLSCALKKEGLISQAVGSHRPVPPSLLWRLGPMLVTWGARQPL